MREILFRGKRKDNNEWVQGHNVFYMQGNDNVFITQTGLPVPTLGDNSSVVVMMHPSTEVWIDTVGQFTGLTDKNGKKIFDGDIVRHWNGSQDLFDTGRVYWDDVFCGWRRTTDGVFHSQIVSTYKLSANCDYEVIGNIHDNPELLEG